MNQPPFTIKPIYLEEVNRYPRMDPLFITFDWETANYIRKLKGAILLCKDQTKHYDLSSSFNKEVWLLYSKISDLNHALSFSKNIQLAGATKVAILYITLREVDYDNNYKASHDHRTTRYQSPRRMGRTYSFRRDQDTRDLSKTLTKCIP